MDDAIPKLYPHLHRQVHATADGTAFLHRGFSRRSHTRIVDMLVGDPLPRIC